jgi:atypical dual specificity phosphatase
MALHNFSWIVKGELAAMGWPRRPERAAEELRSRGIGAIVNLTPRPWPGEALGGMDYLWLPVQDFGTPTGDQAEQFIQFCEERVAEGRAVAVHCLAGRGRTGTLVACYMVHRGIEADEAIRHIRRLRPGSIETESQEQFVRQFAAWRE